MTDGKSPKLGNTTVDIITILAKGSLGAIPIVGSMIAEIIGNFIPNQRIDRISRFIEVIQERLSKLDEDSVKSRLNTPEVIDLLEDAIFQAARSTSSERLEHIANVVVNGIAKEESNQAQSKRMLWLLSDLNDSELVILRSELATTKEHFKRDVDFRQKHAQLLAPDMVHINSNEDELERAALKRSYRQHLHDLGLTRLQFRPLPRGELPEFDDKTGMIKASGADITRLGCMFLKYLNLIPSWYMT